MKSFNYGHNTYIKKDGDDEWIVTECDFIDLYNVFASSPKPQI